MGDEDPIPGSNIAPNEDASSRTSETPGIEAVRTKPRGHLGPVIEDVFRDLYQPPAESAPRARAIEGDGDGEQVADGAGAEGEEDVAALPDDGEVDTAGEEAEIAAIKAAIEQEHSRIELTRQGLDQHRDRALELDKQHADHIQQNFNLVVGQHIPMPDSNLRNLIDHHTLGKDGLVAPRSMIEGVEREVEIRKGTIPQHDNLLAVSKPEEPNHFKLTASMKIRTHATNTQPRLTEAQRAVLAEDLGERRRQRPPMPAVLSGEEREHNRKILKDMQRKVNFLKNPRFRADRADVDRGEACPFHFTPDEVLFLGYQAGGVYELPVEFRNVTKVGRRLRVHPCSSPSFSMGPMRYEGDGSKGPAGAADPSSVIAPGMSAHITVRFAPTHLNDESDALTIATELGDYKVPVKAQRHQPTLEFSNPIDCGCILAGNKISRVVRVSNSGGEGSFRIVSASAGDDDDSYYYETAEDGQTSFVSSAFRISPAAFYLDSKETQDISVTFSSADVGKHSCLLCIEGDNGQTRPLSLTAITDALRLELLRWPTSARPLRPCPLDLKTSPWALVPWQLNWLNPGTQVGCKDSKEIVISNGGHLPAVVEWRFARPPADLLSKLAVGAQQRLSDDILAGIHDWPEYSQVEHGSADCPFTVTPTSLTIPEFSSTNFAFEFHAHAPVARRTACFAYLVALDLPARRPLHYNACIDLQASMQPEDYVKGLPLFGGAVSALQKDVSHLSGRQNESIEKASCAITAVCLQGRSVAASIECLQRVVAFSGDVLPFISHTQEITLRNTGQMRSAFQVRLTSRAPKIGSNAYDPLWVVAPQEVGRPGNNVEASALGMPPSDYTIKLVRLQGADFGIDFAQGTTGLAITALRAGLVTDWNREYPEAEVRCGDELIELNATRVDASNLTDIFGSIGFGEEMTLIFRRKREEFLQRAAEAFASQWVPLPPDDDASRPGFGATGTLAVEPDEGYIMPGKEVTIRVTLRALREMDLNAQLWVDFPVSTSNTAEAMRPIRLGVVAAIRSPRVELREASCVDYGVVRAHASHTMKLNINNPSSLPLLARVRQYGENEAEREADCAFCMGSHQEVVDFFLSRLAADPQGAFAFVEEDSLRAAHKPCVHSRSGCIDQSGRKRYSYTGRRRMEDDKVVPEEGEGHPDSANFLFDPTYVVLWPHQSGEVSVTLRTREVGKYRALLEATAFDSFHTQCIEALAEVQLPVLRLSTQHAHFPVTYIKTPSAPIMVDLRNDSDMHATFNWEVPLKLESGIEVMVEPTSGSVAPRKSVVISVITVPTREAELAELDCRIFVQDNLQPLIMRASAKVFGLEVDYAVAHMGELPPQIKHEPRTLGKASSTSYEVSTGQAPKSAAVIDFGEMQLQSSKSVQVVLYNRSGIATPWAANVANHPAYDPLLKGRKISNLLDATTKMYSMRSRCGTADANSGQMNNTGNNTRGSIISFQSNPQPATQGRDLLAATDRSEVNMGSTMGRTVSSAGKDTAANSRKSTSKFEPKARRTLTSPAAKKQAGRKKKPLLDDKHEKQAFRSNVGAEFANMKEQKAQGAVALQYGHGWAVRVEPSSDWLPPFGMAVITLTGFSDLPGQMEDELVLNVRQLRGHADGEEFRIPMRLLSQGNPLFLPDQQVGLNKQVSPPRLLCGTIVPAEKVVTRSFKVSNNSAAKMKISWNVYGKSQVHHRAEDRKYISLKLCGKKTEADAADALQDACNDVEEDEVLGLEDEGEVLADLDDDDEAPCQFHMWTEEPPEIEDPFAMPLTGDLPLKIEPREATLPIHGSATFTVKMFASKATATADGHYSYKLVGKGRFTEDRQALLNAAMQDDKAESKIKLQLPASNGCEVRDLPDFKMEELHDDDSDSEMVQPARRASHSSQPADAAACDSGGDGQLQDLPRSLPEEPERDVISTIVVDCVGDVIIPRLTVDKKDDDAHEECAYLDPAEAQLDGTDVSQPRRVPVFKFTHSAVAHPAGTRQLVGGATHGGADGGAQIPGIVSCMVRSIALTNRNACGVSCRFRVEGPFRIAEISQVGQFPVKLAAPSNKSRKKGIGAAEQQALKQLFKIDKLETITVQVEFVPELAPSSQWREDQAEHAFAGDIFIEYPREEAAPDASVPKDLQRLHLSAVSRRPVICAIVVPHAQMDAGLLPAQLQATPAIVEFGHVHVESSLTRRRVVLLLNQSNVLANWQLLHVGQKRRGPTDTGDDEDAHAVDDSFAFEFDVSGGDLRGPSKAVLVPGGLTGGEPGVRMPRWFPTGPALPHALPRADEHLFEPLKITITFRPKKNEFYKCRFRFKVEGGISADIICRGHGSYNEEDDAMDFQEA